MASRIVVSVRLSLAGLALTDGVFSSSVTEREPSGGYLERARGIVSRAEALGATLAAWSATTFAFAWEADSVEEAIAFAVDLRDDAPSPEQGWACGIAEGELEPLAPRGQRAELAWGPALVLAVSLARVARPGEVLLDGDVRAVRVGELVTVGTRAATDGGKRVRGWRLDLVKPWRRTSSTRHPRVPHAKPPDPDSTEQLFVPAIREREDDLATTQENELVVYDADVLELVEAAPTPPPSPVRAMPLPPPLPLPKWNEVTERTILPPIEVDLAHQIRKMAHVDGKAGDPPRPSPDALHALRATRARLDGAPPKARCQASLALAVALALAQRPEDALLEGLDALARAREAVDARAEGACLALLAKLYASASRFEHAVRLREVASTVG